MATINHSYEHSAKIKCKKNFEKVFFKLMKNIVCGKTMENLRKNKDLELVIIEARRNYLVSEPSYATNFFSEHLLPLKMKITWILKNKSVCFVVLC